MNQTLAPALRVAGVFLDGLASELYRFADGNGHLVRPLPAIDDPELARHVLSHPEVFVKNYAFLESLGQGRFTANASAWRARADITRHWFGAPPATLDEAAVTAIYARHAAGAEPLDGDALFERFSAAAVEVFSHAIGRTEPLPWPRETVEDLRDLLRIRQWIDWNGCAPTLLADVQHGLKAARETLREHWHASPDARALIDELTRAGASIDAFDAAEELTQNLIASSETTASSLLWIAELLSREPAQQAALHAQSSGSGEFGADFIDEVLRLYPPVPLLTRRCVAPHGHGALQWQPGDVLAISIVGAQRHPDYWARPAAFEPGRHVLEAASVNKRNGAWMPFSHGARACAGRRLAMLELRAGLRALLAARECQAGSAPTGFQFGLASRPRTSLVATQRTGRRTTAAAR